MGAALAYYTVLSLAPLLIVSIAIASLLFSREAVTGQVSSQLSGLIGPSAADTIQSILKNAKSPFSGILASIVGLVTLLFGASGVFSALRMALNRIWDVKPKSSSGIMSYLREQFFSFGMVLGIGFLLLVSLLLSAVLAALGGWVTSLMPGPVMQAINLVISFLVITVLFAAIYRIVPETHVAWSDVIFGATITAFLFTLGKYALGVYLGKASVGSAYGAAGSLIILLVWVYYSAQLFFFGAEFTHIYAIRKGSRKDAAPTQQEPAPTLSRAR